MIIQKHIRKKAEGFGKLSPVFLEAADYALNHQWISADEDLPCRHEELLNAECQTKKVFILKCGGFPDVDYMLKIGGKWIWFEYKSHEFWMPIPDLTKEED